MVNRPGIPSEFSGASPGPSGGVNWLFVLLAGVTILGAGWLGWSTWSSWRAGELASEASAALKAARWDEAEAAVGQLVRVRPDDPETVRLQVQLALAQGDFETAIDALAKVPESDPQVERARMSRGRLLMERFRYREAERVFREVVARNPHMIEARIQLIILTGMKRRSRDFEAELWGFYDFCDQPLSALRMLARGIAILPDRTTVDRSLDEGDLLTKGLIADPEDPEIRPPLARYYLGRGEIDRALELLEPWLEAHPQDAAARVEWLACLLESGDFETPRPWLTADPGALGAFGRYWVLRGDHYFRLGEWERAIDCFEQAARLDQRDSEPRYRLGTALRAAGRAEEAAQALEWVQKANQLKALIQQVRDTGTDPSILQRAGHLCLEMGRTREARAWFESARRANPSDPELSRVLERLSAS